MKKLTNKELLSSNIITRHKVEVSSVNSNSSVIHNRTFENDLLEGIANGSRYIGRFLNPIEEPPPPPSFRYAVAVRSTLSTVSYGSSPALTRDTGSAIVGIGVFEDNEPLWWNKILYTSPGTGLDFSRTNERGQIEVDPSNGDLYLWHWVYNPNAINVSVVYYGNSSNISVSLFGRRRIAMLAKWSIDGEIQWARTLVYSNMTSTTAASFNAGHEFLKILPDRVLAGFHAEQRNYGDFYYFTDGTTTKQWPFSTGQGAVGGIVPVSKATGESVTSIVPIEMIVPGGSTAGDRGLDQMRPHWNRTALCAAGQYYITGRTQNETNGITFNYGEATALNVSNSGLPNSGTAANTRWAPLAAYDSENRIVGVTRIQPQTNTSTDSVVAGGPAIYTMSHLEGCIAGLRVPANSTSFHVSPHSGTPANYGDFSGDTFERGSLIRFDAGGNVVWHKEMNGSARTKFPFMLPNSRSLSFNLHDPISNSMVVPIGFGAVAGGTMILDRGLPTEVTYTHPSNFNNLVLARVNLANGQYIWRTSFIGTEVRPISIDVYPLQNIVRIKARVLGSGTVTITPETGTPYGPFNASSLGYAILIDVNWSTGEPMLPGNPAEIPVFGPISDIGSNVLFSTFF